VIPSTFNWCVDILNWLAAKVGMTYEEVNVWVFCVIWPLITVGLIAVVIVQRKQLRRARMGSPAIRNEPL